MIQIISTCSTIVYIPEISYYLMVLWEVYPIFRYTTEKLFGVDLPAKTQQAGSHDVSAMMFRLLYCMIIYNHAYFFGETGTHILETHRIHGYFFSGANEWGPSGRS